jgi:hypothetical protein
MKRLIVLVSALLLVSMVAIAQSDVTFSGEVEQRWMNDFNNKEYQEGPVVEIKLNAVVDDTASIYIELEEGASGIGGSQNVSEAALGVDINGDGDTLDEVAVGPQRILDKAYFDLDLGAIFMLPVGVTIRTGWDEYDLFDASKITVGEYEDVIGTDWQEWGHQIDVAVNDMIAIRALWANNPDYKAYSFGVAVTYDPVYVEVGYVEVGTDEIDSEIGKGDIEVGSEFSMDVADGINVAAAVNLDYDLNEASTDDTAWLLGAAAAMTYNDMVTLGLAFRGMTDSEANSMQVDLSASPLENLTVFLIAGIGLDSDIYDDAFESFEGSVQLMIGPSTWYAGMIWSAETAPTVIASEKADFISEKADIMGIFMRAELKY